MSKLLDKLDKAGQPAPRRMGFVAADTSVPVPPLVLIVRLDSSTALSISDAAEHADSVILTASQAGGATPPTNLPESALWGIQPSSINSEDISPLTEQGCDYFVLSPDNSPASVLNEENAAKILCVSPSMGEAHLRVLEEVPIDCLLIEHGAKEVLSITDLMTLRSVLTAVSKPSVACVRAGLSEGELSALRHVGVIGIVVDVASEEDIAELPRLRKEIDALPPREEDDRRQVESLGSNAGNSHNHPPHDDDLDG